METETDKTTEKKRGLSGQPLNDLLTALVVEWRKRAAQYWNEPITDKNYEKNQALSRELNKCAYELEVEFKKCWQQ